MRLVKLKTETNIFIRMKNFNISFQLKVFTVVTFMIFKQNKTKENWFDLFH